MHLTDSLIRWLNDNQLDEAIGQPIEGVDKSIVKFLKYTRDLHIKAEALLLSGEM